MPGIKLVSGYKQLYFLKVTQAKWHFLILFKA